VSDSAVIKTGQDRCWPYPALPTIKVCVCCGNEVIRQHLPDLWAGRMDDYCDDCCENRCDVYPDECPHYDASL